MAFCPARVTSARTGIDLSTNQVGIALDQSRQRSSRDAADIPAVGIEADAATKRACPEQGSCPSLVTSRVTTSMPFARDHGLAPILSRDLRRSKLRSASNRPTSRHCRRAVARGSAALEGRPGIGVRAEPGDPPPVQESVAPGCRHHARDEWPAAELGGFRSDARVARQRSCLPCGEWSSSTCSWLWPKG